jgi:hypothetical protein
MFAEKCTEIISITGQLNDARQLRNQAKGIKNRWQQITALQGRLSELVAVSSTLRKHRVPIVEKEGASAALRTNVAEVRDLAKTAPLEFVDSQRVTDLVSERLPDYLERLDRSLRKAWAQFINTRAPAANQEFLAVLNKINAFSATVKTINGLNDRLSQRREALPNSIDDFDDVDGIAKALEIAWQKIGGEKVPSAVRDFLSEAVSSRGAALSSLSREVADWLTDHNIDDQFVVRNRIL